MINNIVYKNNKSIYENYDCEFNCKLRILFQNI